MYMNIDDPRTKGKATISKHGYTSYRHFWTEFENLSNIKPICGNMAEATFDPGE